MRTSWLGSLALALWAVVPLAAEAPRPPAAARPMAGWIEQVRVGELLFVDGKLDTGADLCSLGVERLSEFKRDGKRWVRFTVDHPEKEGRRIRYERRVARWSRIERHGPDDVRPVVRLDICVGSQSRRVEVNLVNRSGFEYPVLIGRNFLAGAFVIDPESRHLLDLDCPSEDGEDEEESR